MRYKQIKQVSKSGFSQSSLAVLYEPRARGLSQGCARLKTQAMLPFIGHNWTNAGLFVTDADKWTVNALSDDEQTKDLFRHDG